MLSTVALVVLPFTLIERVIDDRPQPAPQAARASAAVLRRNVLFGERRHVAHGAPAPVECIKLSPEGTGGAQVMVALREHVQRVHVQLHVLLNGER